jgi:hypothetical protein
MDCRVKPGNDDLGGLITKFCEEHSGGFITSSSLGGGDAE